MDHKELNDVLARAMQMGRDAIPCGNVATYIPELGKADKNKLGLSLFTKDGKRYNLGNTKDRFTIQSISKIITLAAAI